MDGEKYLNEIRAEEMSKEQLQNEIKKLYEDNWAIAKQCDTFEMMHNQKFKKGIKQIFEGIINKIFKKEYSYEKEFRREVIIREYANSNLYGWNINNNRHFIDIPEICFLECDYIPDNTQRIAGMAIADWELLPLHKKIIGRLGLWLDDCVDYLRGIWGITN